MTNEEYWFWICNIPEIYQNTIKQLMDVFYEPEAVYRASEETLLRSGAVDEEKARAIVNSRNNFRCMYKLDKMKKDGVSFVYYGSDNYPEAFLQLPDRPYSVYVKGSLPDPDFPSVGIIGSRKCSGYGKEMTLKYSQTLAVNRVQIISGMALGIDSYASRGAIEAGGKTFVVLGSGLDVIYPPQNIELYFQIILNGGGVISEYPMGTAPIGWQFPHRNRLISALSDKLLVIEARKRSGTLTTVGYALSQGKDIYALPGRTTDPLSEGCNRMIADGAGVLLDPRDILDELYGKGKADLRFTDIRNSREYVNDAYGKVFSALKYEPQIADRIASLSGVDPAKTVAILTDMEIKGICSQTAKDYYSRV